MTYTKHGHQIAGTPIDIARPASVARCGGPGICRDCNRDAYLAKYPQPTGYIKNNFQGPHDLLRYFNFDHLPEGNLRDVSEEFHELAERMDEWLPSGPMKNMFFEDLLRAKDAAVRAALDMPNPAA